MEDSQSASCNTCGSWWKLPLLLGLVLAAIVWSRVHSLREAPHKADETAEKSNAQSADDGTSQKTVSLAIDFGNGRRKNFEAIAWRDGMTVADLFRNDLDIQVSQKGSGESALLTAIDGVPNEGAAGQNWTYAVNGQVADRGFAVYRLRPGDRVLWTFGRRQ